MTSIEQRQWLMLNDRAARCLAGAGQPRYWPLPYCKVAQNRFSASLTFPQRLGLRPVSNAVNGEEVLEIRQHLF